jgi:AcrR family transcriptional regulator
MMDAAIELVVERGVEGATLKEIGERAGYSRGLATYRFGSKAGLFRAVIKDVSQRWLAELTAAVQGKVGIEAICSGVDTYYRFATESQRPIYALYILFYQSIGPGAEFKDRVADVLARQREDVRQWIEDGIAAGQIKPGLDPQRHAEQFVATIAGLTYQWLVSPGCIDFARAHDELKQTMRRALIDSN